MALLIFPPDNLAPQLAELIDPQLRMNVAQNVNQAILQAQGCRREARIRNLVRLRTWAEVKAREAKKDLPADLTLGLQSDTSQSRTQNGNASGNDTAMGGDGTADAEAMVS
jgi:glucose-induced degradation protein 8